MEPHQDRLGLLLVQAQAEGLRKPPGACKLLFNQKL